LIIPDDFAQVNLIFDGTGLPRTAEVVFGVDRSADLNTPLAIAGIVRDVYADTVKAHCSDQVRLAAIRVKNGPNDSGPMAELTTSEIGAADLGACFPNVAALMTKHTDFGGRKGRGRSYWPTLGETVVESGGFLSDAAVTNIGTDLTDFLAGLTTGGIPMVLLHGDALTVPYPVLSVQLQQRTATQRRRLRK
jgi:hypothetical protein